MNLRLKEIRQNLKLTQKEFSQKIGIKQNTLLRLEKGYSKITKKRIKLICSNFGINENWLLNGNGEIFNKSKTEILADNINLRIEKIIKILKLSKKEFANKLNISPSLVSLIINNKVNINSKLVKLIVLTFGINENWLLNGNGEIFNKSKTEILADNKKDLEKEIKENITKINNDLITLKESINKYFNS